MENQQLLFESFNIFYKNGMQAFDEKDYIKAKRNILSASESLLKLAKSSTGQLKQSRAKRAYDLFEFANSIETRIELKTASSKPNTSAQDLSKFTNKNNEEDNSENKFEVVEKPNVRLDDVAGMTNVKEEIRRKIIEPMRHPEIYQKFRKKLGGGILLYGVPGTGKTMIAKAIATEIDAKFYSIKSSDIVSKWFGEAEQNVKTLFDEARKHPLSIIFFDEFEALGTKRDSYSTVMKRLVPELLAQMQGFEQSKNTILLIAATNRPWDIDSAFLRPGRFDTPIYVPLPDAEARKAIIEKKMNGIPFEDGLNLEMMVNVTDGFSGADIADNFCEKIKDNAIERSIQTGVTMPITLSDFEEVKDTVKTSVQKEDLIKISKYEKGEI